MTELVFSGQIDRMSSNAITSNTISDEGSFSWLELREDLLKEVLSAFPGTSAAILSYLLDDDDDVVWLLLDATAALEKCFATSISVTLEFVKDAEAEGTGRQTLFAYVASPLSLTDAMAALERFDEKWLLNQLEVINGRLNFDLRF